MIADVRRLRLGQRDLHGGGIGLLLDALGGLVGHALEGREHLLQLSHAGARLGRLVGRSVRPSRQLGDQRVALGELVADLVQDLPHVVGGGLGFVQLGPEIGLLAGLRQQRQPGERVAPVAVQAELVKDHDPAAAALLLQLHFAGVRALGFDGAVDGAADQLPLAAEVQVAQRLGLHLVLGPAEDARGPAAPGQHLPAGIGEDHAFLQVLERLLEQRHPLLEVPARGDVDADRDVADRRAAADAEARGRPGDGALGPVLDRGDELRVADVLVADPPVVDVLDEPAVVGGGVEPLQQPADVAAVRRVVARRLAERAVEQHDLELEVRDVDEKR